MFGHRSKRHDSSRRLRDIAEQQSRAAIQHLQNRRLQEALASSRQAEQAVRRLREAEPDDTQHVLVLASVLYNQAAILTMGGALADGVRAAQAALDAYESLIPGVGPLHAAESAVFATAGGFLRGRPDGPPAHEVALYAADVKVRLCGLLAEAYRAEALQEVHRLGQEAIEMYEAVSRIVPQHESGLDRVRRQYAAAVSRAVPAQELKEVTHLHGLARFRVPHDWTVASADGVTTADAPGLGRLSLRARIVDEHPAASDDPGVDLRNGCTLHVADSTAPAPHGSTRRSRRWEIVQPLGDQVRLFTFTFDYDYDYDYDYDATGHHAEAVAVLDREIRATELASA